MPSKSDYIERYLLNLLRRTTDQVIEVQRVELANHFHCVPSQINYVLETRFTPEKGYLIESRRGEGGYIRIVKLVHASRDELLTGMYQDLPSHVTAREAQGYVERLSDARILTPRERNMLLMALNVFPPSISHDVLRRWRSHVIRGFIQVLLQMPGNGEE